MDIYELFDYLQELIKPILSKSQSASKKVEEAEREESKEDEV